MYIESGVIKDSQVTVRNKWELLKKQGGMSRKLIQRHLDSFTSSMFLHVYYRFAHMCLNNDFLPHSKK
jgi:hypothetical protein